MADFDFERWREAGRPIPVCTKDETHYRIDFDSKRDNGLVCAICKSDVVFDQERRGDEKKVFVEPV